MDIKLMPNKYSREQGGSSTESATAGLSGLDKKFLSKSGLWLGFSLIILAVVLLICFGLWGYKNSLSKEGEELAKEIEQLQSQRNLDLEADFVTLKKGIENFKKIINKHIYFSNILKMFEELTLPQVVISDLSIDLSENSVSLKIDSVNYETLAKQIVAFEEDARIKEVDTPGVSMDSAGSVGSSLGIKLEPGFLHQHE